MSRRTPEAQIRSELYRAREAICAAIFRAEDPIGKRQQTYDIKRAQRIINRLHTAILCGLGRKR